MYCICMELKSIVIHMIHIAKMPVNTSKMTFAECMAHQMTENATSHLYDDRKERAKNREEFFASIDTIITRYFIHWSVFFFLSLPLSISIFQHFRYLFFLNFRYNNLLSVAHGLNGCT